LLALDFFHEANGFRESLLFRFSNDFHNGLNGGTHYTKRLEKEDRNSFLNKEKKNLNEIKKLKKNKN
jgi:hypothetical protein